MIEISEERDVKRVGDELVPSETRSYVHLKLRVPQVIFSLVADILTLRAVKKMGLTSFLK